MRNLATEIEKGEVSLEQGLAIAESLKNSALPFFLTRVIEISHLEGREFSAEEIAEARQTLERLRYALSTGAVSYDQFAKAANPVVETGTEESDEFLTVKPKPQAEEVKEFLNRTNSLLQSAATTTLRPSLLVIAAQSHLKLASTLRVWPRSREAGLSVNKFSFTKFICRQALFE